MHLRTFVAVALFTFGTAARSETITFDNALQYNFVPTYSEGSFTVTKLFGTPNYGHYPEYTNPPGPVVLYQYPSDYGTGTTIAANNTGTVGITLTNGGLFTYSSLDAALDNYSPYRTVFSQPLVLVGYRNGQIVGSETYSLPTVQTLYPPLTTQSATVLSGVALDQLQISLTSINFPTGLGWEEFVDNVNVTPLAATTPEPSSLLLLGTGLMGAVTAVRRRRR